MECEGWITAVAGFVGVVLGAVLQHFSARRLWLIQQHWNARERYYLDLLNNLAKLRISLEDRNEYFNEPEPEYSKADESESFRRLMKVGGDALAEIRQLKVPARVFLSKTSTDALDKLEVDLWNAAQDSVCTSEYTESALALTLKAQASVLAEAQAAMGPKS